MKSQIDIPVCCFYHMVGRKEVLKIVNEPIYADLINKTSGKKIPEMKRVSLCVEDNDYPVHLDFNPEGATLSNFKLGKFIINQKSYETLIQRGEFHASCGPIAEVYIGIIGRSSYQWIK